LTRAFDARVGPSPIAGIGSRREAMNIKGFVWLAAFLCVAGSISAQQRDSALDALTADALAQNPSIAQRQAAARAATFRIRPAGALPDPMLSAGVMDLQLPGFAFNQSDFTELDLELSQEIPWPSTLGARSNVARVLATGVRAEESTTRREIAVVVGEAYYRLQYATTALATVRRQLALLDAAVQLSTTRYGTGTAPQSDPLQAKLARDRLQSEALVIESDRISALAAVNALRGRPPRDSLAVQPIDAAAVRASLDSIPSTDSLIAVALRVHPRLRAQRAAVEQASQMINVERLAARPGFTFTVRYGYRPRVNGYNFPDFFSAFLGLRLPLWAGRKQNRLADAARADSASAGAALRDAELQLAQQVTEAAARVAAAQQRLMLLTDRVLPTAEAAVESVLRSYQVGRSEFLTLLSVEDSRYRARLEAASVAAYYQTQRVLLRELTAEESAP
jgi:outer membrane protein, heavy metal efflux system